MSPLLGLLSFVGMRNCAKVRRAQRPFLPMPSYSSSSKAMPERCIPRMMHARHVAIPGAALIGRTQRIATSLWTLNACRLALATQTGITG